VVTETQNWHRNKVWEAVITTVTCDGKRKKGENRRGKDERRKEGRKMKGKK
jgi:hypothetical protein